MKTRRREGLTGLVALFLIFNFTFHVTVGVGLLVAGTIVAIQLGEFIGSMGLFGAAAFALFNGIEGFIELFKSVIHQRRYRIRA